MKKLLPFIFTFCVSASLFAQFTDSNLPIVIISTLNNSSIPDQPRVLATMKVIDSGSAQRNYVSDQNDLTKLNYNGNIEIEIRGSSSQSLPKKQYGLTTLQADNVTNNNVSLLGMPEENDWVLNSLPFDASLIRDYISYELSRRIGNYAPRTKYCEVIINGSYQGLYMLQEKIKVDDNRVDIIKMNATDNTLPDVSGGYIIKADKVTSEDPSAWAMNTYLGTFTDFVHESPNSNSITSAQHTYIKSVFDKLASGAKNTSFSDGYPSVIDVPSFIDFMLVNELSSNVDAYQFSTFFHIDKNGKLRAGPLWDLNLTYGNDLTFWGLDRSKTNVWQFQNGDNIGPRFWLDLYGNQTFQCYLSKRWNELTQEGRPLNINSIYSLIDETVALIGEAIVRESERWGTIPSHQQQISGIKSFLSSRIPWITSNVGSFSNCSNVVTPPLVINRIDYHPGTSTQFPNDNDQEFIEIINNSNMPVNLTGMYFRGTGFIYQFPPNAILPPNGVIQLGNDREVFNQKHGYLPFGQFTRNLSNGSQSLTLADGFGNVIDEVVYSDSNPWPAADGNGMYIKLTDPNLDNNVGSNWTSSNEPIVSTEVQIVGTEKNAINELKIFPVPTEETLNLLSENILDYLQLLDSRGRILETITVGELEAKVDLGKYPTGIYFLIIYSKNYSTIRKVIRK
jgi:hypothetical protein